MTESPTLTQLRMTSEQIDAQGFTLEYWQNGVYFIQAPNGEGTEVPEEAVAGALAQLFRKFF